MISIRSDEQISTENLGQSRAPLLLAMAMLINKTDFHTMSFDMCMTHVMCNARGIVSPAMAHKELLLLFRDRGYNVQ